MIVENFLNHMKYNLISLNNEKDMFAKMMDDMVNYISETDNILISTLPIGRFYNKNYTDYFLFDVGEPKQFNTLEEFKEMINLENKAYIVYSFYVSENLKYYVRYRKIEEYTFDEVVDILISVND